MNLQKMTLNQTVILNDKSERLCACMGRQTGKSTIIIKKATSYMKENPDKIIAIVVPFYRMGREINRKIKLAQERFGYRQMWVATPHTFPRGTDFGYVFIDEPAYIDTRKIQEIVDSTPSPIWMLGTPRKFFHTEKQAKQAHVFYKIMLEPNGWKTYHFATPLSLVESKNFRKIYPKEHFNLEFNAKFLNWHCIAS